MKLREYPHFDHQISRATARRIASDPQEIVQHRFHPFLSYPQITRKVQSGNGGVEKKEPKTRLIRYAGHTDSAIYTYYADLLGEKYEAILRSERLQEYVIAFRKLQQRTNIDFAFESFERIDNHIPCVALAFDIDGFFDNLDHQLLKEAYASALGETALPDDHYKVFRAVTKFAWVDQSELKARLGLSRSRPWRGNRRNRICTPAEFRSIVVDGGLIHVNNGGIGIPQGSPISAILSNLYMLKIDKQMATEVSNISGYYRRYCDDILIIVSPEHANNIEYTLMKAIGDSKLKLQDAKTERCNFSLNGQNEIVATRPLQYLGFTFDGNRVHIRSSSVQRYLSRMRRSIKARKRDRCKSNSKAGGRSWVSKPLYTKSLLRRFSPIGTRNFVRYAYRAVKKTKSSDLRKQIKRLVRQFENQLRDARNRPIP